MMKIYINRPTARAWDRRRHLPLCRAPDRGGPRGGRVADGRDGGVRPARLESSQGRERAVERRGRRFEYRLVAGTAARHAQAAQAAAQAAAAAAGVGGEGTPGAGRGPHPHAPAPRRAPGASARVGPPRRVHGRLLLHHLPPGAEVQRGEDCQAAAPVLGDAASLPGSVPLRSRLQAPPLPRDEGRDRSPGPRPLRGPNRHRQDRLLRPEPRDGHVRGAPVLHATRGVRTGPADAGLGRAPHPRPAGHQLQARPHDDAHLRQHGRQPHPGELPDAVPRRARRQPAVRLRGHLCLIQAVPLGEAAKKGTRVRLGLAVAARAPARGHPAAPVRRPAAGH